MKITKKINYSFFIVGIALLIIEETRIYLLKIEHNKEIYLLEKLHYEQIRKIQEPQKRERMIFEYDDFDFIEPALTRL